MVGISLREMHSLSRSERATINTFDGTIILGIPGRTMCVPSPTVAHHLPNASDQGFLRKIPSGQNKNILDKCI
jgi:hypothetical protein